MRSTTSLRTRAGLALAAILAGFATGFFTAPSAQAAGVGDCIAGLDWGTSRPDLASSVVSLVNQHRTSMGLVALKSSPTLTNAAVWKARHMAGYGYMAHDDPAPPVARTVPQRLEACGYPASTTGWGENIAYGYGTAQAVTDAWLNSPGHRANIENGAFRSTGVGAAATANGTIYWSQEFGTYDDSGSTGGGAGGGGTIAAPAVTLNSTPPSSTSSTTATFGWSTTGTVSTTTCQLDAYASVACVSPWTYSGLAAGSHTFRVTVSNAGGSASATYTWSVSAAVPVPVVTAPTVRLTSYPSGWTTSRTATFGWTTTGTITSATCSLDYAVATPCSSPRAYMVTSGRHTFRVAVSGPSGSAGSSVSWYVL